MIHLSLLPFFHFVTTQTQHTEHLKVSPLRSQHSTTTIRLGGITPRKTPELQVPAKHVFGRITLGDASTYDRKAPFSIAIISQVDIAQVSYVRYCIVTPHTVRMAPHSAHGKLFCTLHGMFARCGRNTASEHAVHNHQFTRANSPTPTGTRPQAGSVTLAQFMNTACGYDHCS